jgi:hypothetical protein
MRPKSDKSSMQDTFPHSKQPLEPYFLFFYFQNCRRQSIPIMALTKSPINDLYGSLFRVAADSILILFLQFFYKHNAKSQSGRGTVCFFSRLHIV